MGETSRREFLRSSAAAAAVVSGSSFFEDETLFANSSKSLAIKKGLVYSVLPLTLSHLERFKLAREVGFEVVQAPTTSDERKAEHRRGRSPRQVLRVLLDDGRIRFGHASSSSAAGPPVLRGNWRS